MTMIRYRCITKSYARGKKKWFITCMANLVGLELQVLDAVV